MRPLEIGGTGDPHQGEYNPDAIPTAEQVGLIILGVKALQLANNTQNIARGTASAPFAGLSLFFQLNNYVHENAYPWILSSHVHGVATPQFIHGDMFN